MNTAQWHYDLNPNVGNIDRTARYAAGIVLLSLFVVATPVYIGWATLLALFAIPVVISAIIGWDPLYALFQKHANPLTFPRTKMSIGKLTTVSPLDAHNSSLNRKAA